MRGLNALFTILAMVGALVSAPLFHVHDSDDHGGSFVHAHFLEPEHASPASASEIEARHSHERAHWVDVFTLNSPVTSSFHPVAEFSEPFSLPSPAVNRVVDAVESLHTHSPPDGSDSAPRSPPSN